MRKWALIGLAAVTVLSGCTRRYVVKFNNGEQIVVRGKPKQVGNSFVWKNPDGTERKASEGSIAVIEPEGMARKSKPVFTPEPMR